MIIADSAPFTAFQTVHASYTTAVIDAVFLTVDTCGLAIAGTQSTTVTFGGVDDRLQP